MRGASSRDVLVIDDGGRTDESCVGDLTVLETRAWGLAGMVIWGYHRDTTEHVQIGFLLFSYGTNPVGPRRLDQRGPMDFTSAQFGDFTIDGSDAVFADDDGVLFIPLGEVDRVLEVAASIWKVERKQADGVRAGKKLSEQLNFEEYLEKRTSDPSYTLRRHLRERGGAVEE
jgi:regulator of RNase E activity RraA